MIWVGTVISKTGKAYRDSVLDELRRSDAIYLGAIGHPDVPPGTLEKGILLKLRFELDQYVNLRPVKLYPNVETPIKNKGPKEIDFVVCRENTEGFYVGSGGYFKKGTADEIAIQESINTRKGIERLFRYAFETTKARGKRKKLTLCGKTNVLPMLGDYGHELSRRWPRNIRMFKQTTRMLTQFACGLSKTPNGLT